MPSPQQDLKDKLKFEEKLRPALERYHNVVALNAGSIYAESGDILNMQAFEQPLADILESHYTDVAGEFSNRIRSELPSDERITESENNIIEQALAIWVLSKATLSARRINGTTQDQIAEAIDFGVQDPASRELQGREAQLTVAAIARAKLRRDLAGRESGILMTETQIPAEAAKATEAEVLSGVTPSISGGTARTLPLHKEWISVGDHRVRPAHLTADGQRVPLNEPFIVGGEALRWPGDSDLGASAGNTINCRCSSNTVTSDIVATRREL